MDRAGVKSLLRVAKANEMLHHDGYIVGLYTFHVAVRHFTRKIGVFGEGLFYLEF